MVIFCFIFWLLLLVFQIVWLDLFSFHFVRGDMHPALWGAKVGNSWRTTGDIKDTWER